MRIALLLLPVALLSGCDKEESARDSFLRAQAREYNSCLQRAAVNALRFYEEQRKKDCWGPSDSEGCAIAYAGHRLADADAEKRCVTLYKP